MFKLLDGKQYSQELKNLIKEEIQKAPVESLPILGILQVGDLEESNIYIRHKLNTAKDLGFNTKLIKLPENSDFETIKEAIGILGDTTDGFIIQLPMQTNQIENPQTLLELIPKDKDIDGLSLANLNGDYRAYDCFLPATPLGIILLLQHYNINLYNQKIGVVGQSQIVGLPLANYLEQNGNLVTRYIKSTPKDTLIKNDIVIVATGARNCILPEQVKNNVVLVDVGIHRIDGKIYGDIDFNLMKEKASYITPVPGGVGPMTIISLIMNLIKAKALKDENIWKIFPKVKEILLK
ncbi:bifunctional 5,10-methylenetetrahydrofolate dehydrogenase/5,10-methenyltetrahydrofolate cyclohydrolase [Metamycoplasma neophronis]|uniref:Bifunctional protein FolD n=1 Tax=Metamycoplasma neophronis TaxID=872983 RepID=A0ABY2Z0B0_9BACT|nr:bifunctional 5,10-methylenetetrahydrofolate dehydrogenase/5,10-methenyltetrahydrofolate cyclohydrolase [Metamycoplasma neophronis]TPR54079.1 bifunctional 5,10-methylenetetrahydrofolate dehydrogenase/5,10-methenyltetrahydrofolate cyclohydrolase [Metamycoplasma neophronis]